MKLTVYIANIILNLLSTVLFLIQTGNIRINAFIEDYQYTDEFISIFNIIKIVITVLFIILIFFNYKIQDKEKKNTLLYAICLIEIFTIAGLLLMNSFNIFVPLNVILSIVLIIKDRREKSV